MKILLVEDDPDIGKLVAKYLERKGFMVDWKEDGKSGLSSFRINEYDCCILDINLPHISGMNVLQTIRQSESVKKSTTPVIMLTARSQVYDTLEGFSYGADDYMTKPFHLKELLARIQAVIRRSSRNQDMSLTLAQWSIDEESLVCRHQNDDQEILLSNKEMAVLVYLVRNKGRIISAEELLEHVWDSSVDMLSDTVKTHIKTLRKKIDPDKYLIQTVKGKGYKVE